MTVQELIEKLQRFNPEREVKHLVSHGTYFTDINMVVEDVMLVEDDDEPNPIALIV